MTEAGQARRHAAPRHLALGAVVLFGVALATAAGARYLLIEPADLAHACADDPGSALCHIRDLVVLSFRHQAPGWVAAIAGAVAWLLSSRDGGPASFGVFGEWRIAGLAGLTAVGFGAIGLMLYSFNPAAVGLVLGAIALSRLSAARQGAMTST